jgi:hypothetical protein
MEKEDNMKMVDEKKDNEGREVTQGQIKSGRYIIAKISSSRVADKNDIVIGNSKARKEKAFQDVGMYTSNSYYIFNSFDPCILLV